MKIGFKARCSKVLPLFIVRSNNSGTSLVLSRTSDIYSKAEWSHEPGWSCSAATHRQAQVMTSMIVVEASGETVHPAMRCTPRLSDMAVSWWSKELMVDKIQLVDSVGELGASSVRGKKSAAGIIYVPLQGRRGHNLTNVWGQLVSQGDATEKLAHQVAAQVAAADRRVEEASGDPHEEEKDEAHKSSKGHVSEPAAGCPTSPESLTERNCSLDMDDKEKEDLCVGSLPQQQTKIQEPHNRVTSDDEPQRSRPPD
ncbi:uncharacterized protein LOC144462563 [Epinephelus lanceolatus]